MIRHVGSLLSLGLKIGSGAMENRTTARTRSTMWSPIWAARGRKRMLACA